MISVYLHVYIGQGHRNRGGIYSWAQPQTPISPPSNFFGKKDIRGEKHFCCLSPDFKYGSDFFIILLSWMFLLSF